MHRPFTRRSLRNGLTVVLEEDHTVPVAAINIWYHVGSRDEAPNQRGVAHLFEHLMFQGSLHAAVGEHSDLLDEVGAYVNATTHFDRTNYFETVPVHALPLALWLEADRMGTLRDALSEAELDAQREVVKNERLETMVDVPYGEVLAHLAAGLFPAGHPYRILPIGEMRHLDAVAVTDLQDFFDHHYAPDNAVLTVVGDIDSEATFELIERYFAAIPAGPGAEPIPQPELPPAADVGPVTLRDPQVTDAGVFRAWRAPAIGDERFEAFEIAMAILGRNQSSRLRRRLVVDDRIAVEASAHSIGLAAGNSLAYMSAIVAPGATVDAVLAGIDTVITSLADSGPDADELQIAIANLVRERIEEQTGVAGRADALSMAQTLFGDAARTDLTLTRIQSVTAADVQDVVREWITPAAAVTVVYLPTAESEMAA